jgi:hypothetical protein
VRPTSFLKPTSRIQKRRFTIDEDAALRAGFERLSSEAGDDERRELCRSLGTKLSRTAAVIQQRARLLGYWESGTAGDQQAPAAPVTPVVNYNAGSFTPEEDAIIWEIYTQPQHRTEASSSSATAAPAEGTGGVLGYVSELAELLGRSYTQVQRRLDRLRAQDQARPR